MNPLLIAPIQPKLLRESITAFSVVMAYDEAIAGQTSRQIYRRLLTQCDDRLIFQPSSWTFEELKDPCVADEAIRLASAANLIIVATVNGKILPRQVKRWIETSMLKKQDQESALAVVIGNASAEMLPNAPAHQYLKRVAEEANIKFLGTVFELPRKSSCYSLSDLMEKYQARTTLLEEILNRPPPPPRWGLNE